MTFKVTKQPIIIIYMTKKLRRNTFPPQSVDYENKPFMLFLYCLEAVSENLVAVDNINKCFGVDVVDLFLEVGELTS